MNKDEQIESLLNILNDLMNFTFKLIAILENNDDYTLEQIEKFSEIKQRIWTLQHKLNLPQE